jgi:hypothetical protein
LILKQIDLETPSDPMGRLCTEHGRPIESLDGRSKQMRKEERGIERKKGGGGGVSLLQCHLVEHNY